MTNRRRTPGGHEYEDAAVRAIPASRRHALRLLLGSSLLPLVGCESGGTTDVFGPLGLGDGGGADSGLSGDGGVSGEGGSAFDGSLASGDGATQGTDSSVTGTQDAGGAVADGSASGNVDAGSVPDSWASGGTSSMTDKGSYPDPFTAAAASCILVASTTEGPCTTASDLSREDVSEGWTGLPVRLALQVVDASCSPLSGATVKIWHTNLEGSYSGQTPNNGMCLKDQGYSSQDFFRGVQTTDASGKVYFDTCFPGWYRGRAVHIHFQVKSGNTSYRVSQLGFPSDVISDIFSSHPDYQGYGQPDTSFATDNIFGGVSNPDAHILEVSRMTDGAMLASKVVAVV